ncbi:MAG: hypothetical protein HY319_21875 [Armatimonadetes bacterium]|nr:hypothetical protein [Armatimonadota bacterium]
MDLTLKAEMAEHADWARDCENWKSDLARWKLEHEQAMNDLKRVMELMRYRARGLQLHKIAIESLQSKMSVRQNAARLYKAGEGSSQMVRELGRELCAEHQEVRHGHLLQLSVHAKLFQLHREMLQEIHQLLRLLEPVEGIVKYQARIGKHLNEPLT